MLSTFIAFRFTRFPGNTMPRCGGGAQGTHRILVKWGYADFPRVAYIVDGTKVTPCATHQR